MDIHKVLAAMNAVEAYIRSTHSSFLSILGPREFNDWVESLAGEAVAIAQSQIERWDEEKASFSYFAVLKAKELLRKERTSIRRNYEAQQALVLNCRETAPRDEFGQYLLRDELKGVLQKLTFNQRAAVALRYLCGCSATEIARILNCTEDAVHSILYRARSQSREYYLQMRYKPPLKPKPPPPSSRRTSHLNSQGRTS